MTTLNVAICMADGVDPASEEVLTIVRDGARYRGATGEPVYQGITDVLLGPEQPSGTTYHVWTVEA